VSLLVLKEFLTCFSIGEDMAESQILNLILQGIGLQKSPW
jgi:hypothetical protein